MRVVRLAAMFSRPGPGSRAALVLPIVAFAVVSALVLVVLAGVQVFFSWSGDTAVAYQALAVIALALLIVPLLGLGGSAARLSARRRDDRLSTLRLLGASGGTVAALTVIESTALALIGALAGVAGYSLLVPLVGLIQFRGEPLGGEALWMSALEIVCVVVAMLLLAATSALIGLRRVVISPLGVRVKQSAPTTHWMRVVIGVIVVALSVGGVGLIGRFGGSAEVAVAIAILTLLLAFGCTLAILNLIGPWVVRLFASRQAKRAKNAARLIAARAVLESPKAAWRQISGVAMTSFMAVFAGSGLALAQMAQSSAMDQQSRNLTDDIRTGIFLTIAISFLMVACSVGVNQAAGILDRRDLYVSLDRLGMPVSAMDASRRRAVMSPLRIVTVGSALCAAVVILPLTGIALIIAPLSIAVIVAALAGGIGLVWLGLRATRPVLRRVLREPERV
jgi:hypothetical protein